MPPAKAHQVNKNASWNAASVFSESQHGTTTPSRSRDINTNPETSFSCLPGVQSMGEGQHLGPHVECEYGDNPNEEETLVVLDQRNTHSSQPMISSKQDDGKLRKPNTFQVSGLGDEAMLGPRLPAWTNDYSSRQSANFPQTDQSYNSNTNQVSEDLPRSHSMGGWKGNCITAPKNDLESMKKVEMVNSAQLQKKPIGIRTGTGPRSRTAKEWFAKNSQDTRPFIPDVAGMKRKRSKNDHGAGRCLMEKGKLQMGPATTKTRTKNDKNGKSIKVMSEMFKSLKYSNPIEARIALGDLPEADPIKAATKGDQFQQIMKSLPKDADKRSATADRRRLDEATRSFGLGNCVAKDGKWLVKGMKTSLHDHQVIGASWMLSREFCEDFPKGGILADEMGMGKTLETLACIVSNRPTEADTKECAKTTLIVAPAAAIKQWEEEIRNHVDNKYINTIFHYKQSKEIPFEFLKVADIILVSYQEVPKHFPSKKLRAQLQNNCRSEQEVQKKYDDKLGLLFKIPFWRVVLDEGHNIKNRDSQTSIACQNLKGRYRWALSGTPVTNSLDEFYPYLKFLKVDFGGDLKSYRHLYLNTRDVTATKRLNNMMDTIMIRRTMQDSFLGRPLYEIPKPHYDVRRVNLTKEERIIYNVVEKRARGVINDVLGEAKTQGRQIQTKDLKKYLILFLRLRQAAAHPFLLEQTMMNELEPKDLLIIKRQFGEVEGKLPFFKRIGEWCAEKAMVARNAKYHANSNSSFGNSQFGYDFNMDRQLDLALASQKEDVCRLCYQEATSPQIAKCNHVFCEDCLEDYLKEFDDRRKKPKCPDCDKTLAQCKPVEQSNPEYSNTQRSTSETESRIALLDVPKLGLDKLKKHPKLGRPPSKFLRQCDQAYPEPVVPSAKTTAVKEAILEWRSEAPEDKVIVFVEFRKTQAILGRMLEAEGIPFLYFGEMSPAEKQNAVQAFKEKDEIKVMIMSMKCGAVALNLTVANRVIIVDLWWNLALEMQAYARVFRIGQKKKTYFLRIIAENTVDNQMEALQEAKKENISKIMEPGENGQLSTEEILSLFGNVKRSADGSLEVLPNDGDGGELDEGSKESEEVEEDEDA